MPNYCGGIKLGDTLKVDKGIITLADHTSVSGETITPCGMLWDSNIFEVGKHNGAYILTSVGVDEDMDMPMYIKSNCGLNLDSRYFTLNEDRSIDFDESYVLEVLVEPHDATITVTYGDADTPVEPIQGTTNMFKLTEIDETYTITASKEGYTSQEQQITADQNHIVEFTLVEAP